MLVRDVVRVQARLKFIYRSRAVATTGTALYSPAHRDQWQARLPEASRAVTTKLYAHYDFLLQLKKQAGEELVTESRKHPIARILQTAPGIGPIRVARLLPIVVTPHRFRTKRQFWSYCGLGIVMRSSSDWVRSDAGQWQRALVAQTRGLSKKHNHTLKDIFKGAATTVIQQGKPVPIYADYERLLESGTKPNLAKLTVARKIAAIVLCMWKEQEVYRAEKTVNTKAAVRAAT
jgi:transposase